MNIAVDINQIDLKNIYFLDSKKNIIVNGKFTRLMYTDACFSMNGLYINFPIFTPYINQYSSTDNLSLLNNEGKNLITFNINNPHNISIVKFIGELEYRLLEYYRQEFSAIDKDIVHKKISNNLSSQLNSGSIKLYKEKHIKLTNNASVDNLEKNIDFIMPKKHHKIIYPPPGFSNINPHINPHINYSLSDSNLFAISNMYSNGVNMFSPREKIGFSNMSYNIADNINATTNMQFLHSPNKNTICYEQKRIVIVLKISGIWETKDEMGLTYKFLEMFSK